MNPAIDKTQYLIRRELWENRGGVVWAPITIAAAVSFLVLLGLIFGKLNLSGGYLDINMSLEWMEQHGWNESSDEPVRIIDFRSGTIVVSSEKNLGPSGWDMNPANIMFRVQHGSVLLLELVAFFVAFVYLLGALYNDRKDRSILFWKSLPISETSNVLSKLFFAVLVIPLIALVCSIPLQLVLGFTVSLAYSFSDNFTFFGVFSELHPIGIFLTHLFFIVVFGIKSFPLYAWLLFSSAISKRSPMLIAVLVPLLIITVESLVFGTSYLSDFVASLFFADRFDTDWMRTGNAFQGAAALLSFSILQIIKITVVSGAFLTGAIWFRNNRYEI